MSTHVWQGDAIAVAQESRATPANVGAGDVFTLTLGGVAVSYTAASGDGVAEVVAGLVAVWNASTAPQLTEITASDQTSYVKLLHDTAGVEFTVAGSTTDGDSNDTQTLAISTPTAAAGPYVWAAANFDSGALPANGDTVVFEDSDVDVRYGLNQSTVTLAVLRIKKSYTGQIGLARTAAASYHKTGTSSYTEYRDTYLRIGATSVEIGEADGSGSSRLKLDLGTAQTTINVHDTGSSSEVAHRALILKGSHASNVVNVNKGQVEVAPFAGETATIATLRVGYKTNRAGDSDVRLGSGVTLTTIEQSGGLLDVQSAATTLNLTGGICSFRGSGAMTTLNLDGGTCHYQSSGTLSALNLGSGGVFDCRRDMRSRTVSVCEAYGGALYDPHKTVTWSAGIDLHRTGPAGVTLDIGENLRLTPGAIS